MINVFIDTDILIDYANGYDKGIKLLLKYQKNNQVKLYINPVVYAEFLTDKRMSDSAKLKKANIFLKLFENKLIIQETGMIAGGLMRNNKIYLGDAFIAASCLQYNFQLFTGNKKHFSKVGGLSFY